MDISTITLWTGPFEGETGQRYKIEKRKPPNGWKAGLTLSLLFVCLSLIIYLYSRPLGSDHLIFKVAGRVGECEGGGGGWGKIEKKKKKKKKKKNKIQDTLLQPPLPTNNNCYCKNVNKKTSFRRG